MKKAFVTLISSHLFFTEIGYTKDHTNDIAKIKKLLAIHQAELSNLKKNYEALKNEKKVLCSSNIVLQSAQWPGRHLYAGTTPVIEPGHASPNEGAHETWRVICK